MEKTWVDNTLLPAKPAFVQLCLLLCPTLVYHYTGEQLKKPSSAKCKVSKIKVLTEYESMSREELIQELAISKINEARAKKGYMVKGVGSEKEYIPLSKQSTK